MGILMSFLNALPGSIAQGLIWGIMALGVAVTYQVLNYSDLSVDGSICTGGAVCAVCIAGGMDPLLALLFALLAGMLAGFVTGVLHTVFGIPAILSGILTQLALYSINMRIMGKSNVTISRTEYNLVLTSASNETGRAIVISAVFAVCVIGLLYWFFGTELGSAIRATGNNEKMARAQGINTNKMKMLGLIISNGIVGLAGGLLAQYQGNADVNMGRGAIVIGLAAVVIGKNLIGKKENFAIRLSGIAVGGIVYYAVLALVVCLGLSSSDLKLFSAAIVAIFLAVPYVKSTYFKRKNTAPAQKEVK